MDIKGKAFIQEVSGCFSQGGLNWFIDGAGTMGRLTIKEAILSLRQPLTAIPENADYCLGAGNCNANRIAPLPSFLMLGIYIYPPSQLYIMPR